MALFLRDEEVRQVVDMEQMLAAIETMQARFGQGEAYNLPRRKIIAKGGMLAVMGGGLFYDGVMGVKTYTVVKGVYSFQVSLYDAGTGRLLCYTQANRLGQLRTGATTALAVKHLAKGDAVTVAILGTGYQAPTQLEAVRQVRNLRQVRAFSRNAQRRQQFAETMTDALGVDVVAASSAQEAIAGSDVVICIAATMTEPVVQGDWLAPGCTVVAAGPTTWRAREVDDATLTRADKLVVDSIEQAPLEAGDLASAADRGLIQWSQLQELRQVVAGNVKGRDNPRQIIYAKMMGTGVADVAAAKLAYDRAKAAGVGVEMEW
ncbi:MAG: ornithine cyclodeaminase family protein [Dehalococcoidia bacterium]|nr:ornithine cyclodeaminase family protein [Dehalococcoidia bacterium]MSQ17029.1 ornithine cyclodeaminase family protein [Dehalococcoidia bacterium]